MGLYTKQESSYLGKTIVVSIWSRMVLTQIMIRIYKDSHLDIFTKYQDLIGITILIPTCRFFNIIIGVDY